MNHEEIQNALDKADTHYKQKNYKKALTIYIDCFYEIKNMKGYETDIVALLSKIEKCYYFLGNYDESLKIAQYNYKMSHKIFGKKHAQTLSILNDLSLIYCKLRQYQKAMKLCKKCIHIQKEKEDTNILTSLSNLAGIYNETEDYKKALDIDQQAYELCKEYFGEHHPNMLDILYDLSFDYENLEDYPNVVKIEKQRYALNKELYGEEEEKTMANLNKLGYVYYLNNQHEKYVENAYYYFDLMNKKIKESIVNQTMISINETEVLSHAVFLYKNYYFYHLNTKSGYPYLIAYKNILEDGVCFDMEVSKIQSQLNEDDLLFDIYGLVDDQYGVVMIDKNNFEAYMFEDKETLQDVIDDYQDKHIYLCLEGNLSYEDDSITYISSPKALFLS